MTALDRFLRRWTAALAGYEEASGRYTEITRAHLALVGTPRHPGRGAHRYVEAEVRLRAKQDYGRQKAISDQQFFAAEATMYGVAALVEMIRESR